MLARIHFSYDKQLQQIIVRVIHSHDGVKIETGLLSESINVYLITCKFRRVGNLPNGEGVAVWLPNMPASRLLAGQSGQVAESTPAKQVYHRRHRKVEEMQSQSGGE